jgi:SAM-dependent methyltransferase/uncharacterized protein YbaR (Trm112 family)
MTDDVLGWLTPFLCCPTCRQRLKLIRDDPTGDGILSHREGTCGEEYPVIDGVPRLLTGGERNRVARTHATWFSKNAMRRALGQSWSKRTIASDDVITDFDFEWSHFAEVGTRDQSQMFEQYFDLVEPRAFGKDLVVLDAGCGAGRWALEVAKRGPRVIAVDLGLSVDVARKNTRDSSRVGVIQADLHNLPITEASVDWAYSLGVLHHVQDPPTALRRIVQAIRPGGGLLLYLYYALDNRGRVFKTLFAVIDGVRRLTSSSPRPVAVTFATVVAIVVYWPLARLAALLSRIGALGLANALPLSYYRERGLRTMLNDSLDRFGTRIERRYTRRQVIELMEAAGTQDVIVSALTPYWHAWARTRSDRSISEQETAT